ncbi:hypothetical protein Ana3638_11750 [Anaerocolumna sedimenticola]|uniref:Uncharacterized protein n=1 Tax=Anaerocolumna sedimenticola TaxID=2696063 RepID=A0A6P1TLR5_9FIRM|nr:hypothetical protein [Anaerocolumna sedimenticola]QHQ61363.1 hypothetical protein Ana3638_11750 [Anaerocolumna sedimenticola]
MDANLHMTPTNTISFAKEITLKAIEFELIPKYCDPKDGAKAVTDFYKTTLKTINND